MYTPELADEICIRIAGGRTVFSVCRDEDMPEKTTFYRWMIEKPEFREKITCARDERVEFHAKELRGLAKKVMSDPALDPMRVNAAVNALDKAAKLMQPKTKRIELGGIGGGPIQTAQVDATALSDSTLQELLRAHRANGPTNVG